MYIKTGHRFLTDKGQIVFPGPPTRSAFSFSYVNPPTTTTTAITTTTAVTLPDPPEIDDDTDIMSGMLSDKIQMFYIYITVTITSVLLLILLGTFAYMCYKRKGFQSIDSQQDIETTRRQSSRRARSHSKNYSKERETESNPGQTLLR